MNKKVLRITGIVVVTFALIANLQYALLNYGLKNNSLSQQLYAQSGSDEEDVATPPGGDGSSSDGGGSSGGGSGMGCYSLYILECPIEGGQQSVCNFSGVYGEPYNCEQVNCLLMHTKRHCVQRQ